MHLHHLRLDPPVTEPARPRGCLTKPPPGTRVRFTPYFLAHVPAAKDQRNLRWTVIDCACGLCTTTGKHVAVNEPAVHDEMYDDVPPNRRPRWRHINFTNLQIVFESTQLEAPPTPRRSR
jgi:hypothetical protein